MAEEKVGFQERCTGVYVGGEYDDGPPRLVHNEYTYCPVHDNRRLFDSAKAVVLPVPTLTLDDYQASCAATAIYPQAGTGRRDAVNYAVIELADEAGEVAGKWKKVLRGDGGYAGDLTPETRAAMVGELGDVLWAASRVATELGVKLSDVAQGNLDKLASRKERGVLKGNGDNR